MRTEEQKKYMREYKRNKRLPQKLAKYIKILTENGFIVTKIEKKDESIANFTSKV